MLRPQGTTTRDTKCLSVMWDFAFDADDRIVAYFESSTHAATV